jgi:hypothetical protein
MTRTEMRSAAATLQVLAAVRGDYQPPAGLTVDLLLAAGNPDRVGDSMNRRIPRTRPFDVVAGRAMRYPRLRSNGTFARG